MRDAVRRVLQLDRLHELSVLPQLALRRHQDLLDHAPVRVALPERDRGRALRQLDRVLDVQNLVRLVADEEPDLEPVRPRHLDDFEVESLDLHRRQPDERRAVLGPPEQRRVVADDRRLERRRRRRVGLRVPIVLRRPHRRAVVRQRVAQLVLRLGRRLKDDVEPNPVLRDLWPEHVTPRVVARKVAVRRDDRDAAFLAPRVVHLAQLGKVEPAIRDGDAFRELFSRPVRRLLGADLPQPLGERRVELRLCLGHLRFGRLGVAGLGLGGRLGRRGLLCRLVRLPDGSERRNRKYCEKNDRESPASEGLESDH